jgi:hypothetical protein
MKEGQMTQDFGGYPLGDDDQPAQPSAAGVAREQAVQVGQSVREAGGQVAGTAAERAKDVVSEAQWQGRDLLGQAQRQVRDQAQAQQHKAAGRMHSLADELSAMAANGDQGTSAAVLVREAAGSLRDAASWLEKHEPGDLVEEVRRFARRRPGVFVLAAAAAGVAAGRLTRGTVAAQKDDQPETSQADNGGWTAQTASQPVMPASVEAAVWAPDAPAYPEIQP